MTASSTPIVPQFISVKQAAVIAGLSADTIRAMLEAGTLPSYRPVKGRIVIDRIELVEAIKATPTKPVRNGRGRPRNKPKSGTQESSRST